MRIPTVLSFLLYATARVASAGWAGAAVLFVITGIQEVRTPKFDSVVRSELVLLRFPAYYAFGFVLVAVAFVATALLCWNGSYRKRFVVVASFFGLALLMMTVDYFYVFGPLAEMTAQVDQARPAEFHNYHRASMYVNTIDVGLMLLGATIMCWPVPSMFSDAEPTA